jgi:hypothetical protein
MNVLTTSSNPDGHEAETTEGPCLVPEYSKDTIELKLIS